jgi:eukaryotic translation initiation factor 2C
MVSERTHAYFRATRTLPKKILYYRDGVSTGQFAQVRDEELSQIRSACKTAGCPNVKVTVVIAVKRHSTRFFPSTTGNCKPGTLVDRAITSPHYSDFYLQSHHGLKGTAIPTHYMVVANEIGFKDTELQELTYKLCYTYARATLGVSYPPPAYYADRLCDRGRAYLKNWFSPDRVSAEYNSYVAIANSIKQREQGRLAHRKASLATVAPLQPGRNASRKSADEIVIEKEHERFVEGEIAKAVLNRAVVEWNRARSGGPGPWAKELDDTMFWM